MKKRDVDTALQKIESIKRVEASPFLLTRIEAALESNPLQPSGKVRFALIFMISVLVLVNSLVIWKDVKSSKTTSNNGDYIVNVYSENQWYE